MWDDQHSNVGNGIAVKNYFETFFFLAILNIVRTHQKIKRVNWDLEYKCYWGDVCRHTLENKMRT